MVHEPVIEIHQEVENGVWLRVVRQQGERHVFITCDVTDADELASALALFAQKVAEGFTFRGVVPTPEDYREFWLAKKAE